MRHLLTIPLLASLLATSALAGGVVEVRSTTPSRVFLSGEFVGDTPLRLSQLAPGDHEIQIEDGASGEVKTFFFHSPTSATVEKTIEADFGRTLLPAPAPQQAPVAVRRVVHVPAAPARCATPRTWGTTTYRRVVPASGYYGPHGSRQQRAKVHTRNTLGALTVASQVFTGNSRDRKRYRNVGLGLGFLNEILR